VYIPDRFVTLLVEHVRRYRPGDDPDRWLFPGSRDARLPAHAATVARSWRIVRDRVGITNRLHDLRHFYASGLIRAGRDVLTAQRALGHSSAAITLATYSPLWPDANDRIRKAAAELFAESVGTAADQLRTEDLD
jgi:integrase